MSEGSGQILQEGPLRYYAARHTTVLAATPLGQFKLFQIAFGKDGSIYLPFPYLETKRGLLSEVDPSIEPDPKTISLRRNGIDVTTDVKFSHHTSGIVQFSKTGGQDLLPRRQSFRLDGPIGKIFDLHVYWLHGFTQFDPEKAGKTFLLPFQLPDEHRTSLHVWAEWRRKKDIIDNLEPGGTWLGPGVSAITRATGTEVRFLLLGQPEGFPLRDHVLMLSVEEVVHADGADIPTMIFLGGYDQHEGAAPATQRMLAFMYPVGDGPPGG